MLNILKFSVLTLLITEQRKGEELENNDLFYVAGNTWNGFN